MTSNTQRDYKAEFPAVSKAIRPSIIDNAATAQRPAVRA